jgi:hypothetical protein
MKHCCSLTLAICALILFTAVQAKHKKIVRIDLIILGPERKRLSSGVPRPKRSKPYRTEQPDEV